MAALYVAQQTKLLLGDLTRRWFVIVIICFCWWVSQSQIEMKSFRESFPGV